MKYADHVVGPDGEFVPFVFEILDNSKGPGDRKFVFCIVFFIRDLDVNCAACPAGKCSRENPAEKLNGSISKRQQGGMIIYDALNPDKGEAAKAALGGAYE